MATIVTRSGKGSPLTNTEVDSNFTNLNTDKLELSGGTMTGDLNVDSGSLKVRSTSGSTLELTNTSTTLGDNAFVGGLAFRNDDTSGSEPHYAGIKARTDGAGGTEMDLEFYANRDKYETDAPHMILRSTGNLDVGGNLDVTGTVTADAGSWSAVVSGNAITFDRNGENNIIADSGSSANLNLTAGNRIFYSADDYQSFKIGSSPTEKLRILSTGIQVTGNIANTSGDLTLDVAGDIILDADGGDVRFKDGGTHIGSLYNSSNNFAIYSAVNNADMLLQGQDGGSTITALTLDMSDAGTATFSHDIKLPNNGKALFGASGSLEIYHDGSTSIIRETGSGDLRLQGANIDFKDPSGQTYAYFNDTSGAVSLYHNNAQKLATTSTGIDVTGTVTATGTSVFASLDISGNIDVDGTTNLDNTDIDGTLNASGLSYVNSGNGSGVALKIGGEGGSGLKTQYILASGHTNYQIGVATHAASVFSITPSTSAGNTTFTNPALNIDSSGNVGIGGTAVPSATNYNSASLHVRQVGSSSVGAQLRLTTGVTGHTASDGSFISAWSDNGLYITNQENAHIAFSTNNAEAMRIDSSGNLLVGKSSADGTGSTGHDIRATGLAYHTVNGGTVKVLNRTSSDGDILSLRKDGSVVGSINATQGRLAIGNGDTGLKFSDSDNAIMPFNVSTNANRDNAVDLGVSSVRFKDLYLSGSIANPSGDLTVDVSGNITLDADGGSVFFKDAGTEFFKIRNTGSDVQIYSARSDADIKFEGVDGGVGITALTLDMSDAGRANFNNDIGINDDRGIRFGSDDDSVIYNDGSNLYIKNSTSNQDIIFQGNDDGSANITALTLDMSDAGAAHFNTSIYLGDGKSVKLGASADLQLYHEAGGNSFIAHTKTSGWLNMPMSGSGLTIANGDFSEIIASFKRNGSCDLYYNGSKKIETTSSGVTVTGTINGGDCRGEIFYMGRDTNDYFVVETNQFNWILDGAVDMRLYDSGDLHVEGNVIAYSTTISDERLKKDIVKIDNALDKVAQLNGYTFTYTADGKKSAGVIAQEVQKVLPSAIIESKLPLKMGDDDETEYMTVQYDQLMGLMVEAIKELRAEVSKLKGA